MTSRRLSARNRRGAGALEVVLVSNFILLPMIVGTIELTRAFMVQQVLVNAAREGARRAVVPNATDAELTGVDGILPHYLSAGGIPDTYTVEIYVNDVLSNVDSALSQDEVRVQVTVPYSDISWIGSVFVPSDTTLGSATVMRKE